MYTGPWCFILVLLCMSYEVTQVNVLISDCTEALYILSDVMHKTERNECL